jgi:hypothetical protein
MSQSLDCGICTATEDMECFRCNDLGISTKTILRGDDYVWLDSPRGVSCACLDCWDRLLEEIEESNNL